MAREHVGWFYESASARPNNVDVTSKSSFGRYQESDVKTFEEHYSDLADDYKSRFSIDIKKDMNGMISDLPFMETFKTDLMAPIITAFQEASPNDPHFPKVCEEVNKFWDTKVKTYNESASLMGFLPISTLEFPVLVKQFFSSIIKDIIEIESVKTPNITKHVRTTYMIDNNTGDEYEYPKCMFDGTWEKLWDASKGLKIPETVVPFTNGRLWKFDLISHAKGTPGIDKLSLQFKIIGIQVGADEIMLRGNGITVEFSTNGTLVNGDLNFDFNGTQIEDTLGGQVDFKNGTISMSSSSGQVTGVIFSGYLSNEKNLRTVSVREKRDIIRYTIEDGPRWSMPFSMEEIDDASALLDMNYYNRMVDEVVKTQEMQECMTVIKFLQDEYKKFNGVDTDVFNLESMAMTYEVNIDPPTGFAGDPFKYIATSIQFRLKSIIHQITELTKLEGLSFIVVGNPMACQLIAEFTNWKCESGTSIGGIDVNSSYGFATDMGANVRVVASNLYDAYTVDPVDTTNERELVLHIYCYPTSDDRITFRHLKYTSHLFTSQSQTAYQSPQAPAGAYNIVTATSRFKTLAVQGIQARLVILNSKKVYGNAPTRPPVMGAPWDAPNP